MNLIENFSSKNGDDYTNYPPRTVLYKQQSQKE